MASSLQIQIQKLSVSKPSGAPTLLQQLQGLAAQLDDAILSASTCTTELKGVSIKVPESYTVVKISSDGRRCGERYFSGEQSLYAEQSQRKQRSPPHFNDENSILPAKRPHPPPPLEHPQSASHACVSSGQLSTLPSRGLECVANGVRNSGSGHQIVAIEQQQQQQQQRRKDTHLQEQQKKRNPIRQEQQDQEQQQKAMQEKNQQKICYARQLLKDSKAIDSIERGNEADKLALQLTDWPFLTVPAAQHIGGDRNDSREYDAGHYYPTAVRPGNVKQPDNQSRLEEFSHASVPGPTVLGDVQTDGRPPAAAELPMPPPHMLETHSRQSNSPMSTGLRQRRGQFNAVQQDEWSERLCPPTARLQKGLSCNNANYLGGRSPLPENQGRGALSQQTEPVNYRQSYRHTEAGASGGGFYSAHMHPATASSANHVPHSKWRNESSRNARKEAKHIDGPSQEIPEPGILKFIG